MTQNEKKATRILFADIIKECKLSRESLGSINQVLGNDFIEANQKRRDLNNALADLYTKYANKQPDEDFIIREHVCLNSLEKYTAIMQIVNIWGDANNATGK